MFVYEQEINNINDQIREQFSPEAVILFGSCAKGAVTRKSDIDLCVIVKTNNKRELMTEMLLNLEYERDLDIVIYTPEEWAKYHQKPGTFAQIIFSTGVKLLG